MVFVVMSSSCFGADGRTRDTFDSFLQGQARDGSRPERELRFEPAARRASRGFESSPGIAF